jgi:hypothetical protein
MAKLSKTMLQCFNNTNAVLKYDMDSWEYRQGMISVINLILMDNRAYKGYRYLTINEVPAGQLPGINLLNGEPHPDYEKRFANTDATRREYILKD